MQRRRAAGATLAGLEWKVGWQASEIARRAGGGCDGRGKFLGYQEFIKWIAKVEC